MKFGPISMLFGLFSQVFGVKEFIFGVKKAKISYTLIFCVLGESFRGGGGVGGGGSKTYKQVWKSHYKTCVPQVTRQVYNLFQRPVERFLGFIQKVKVQKGV